MEHKMEYLNLDSFHLYSNKFMLNPIVFHSKTDVVSGES